MIPQNLQKFATLTLICFLFTSCSGKFSKQLNFSPAEGLRVAVMPFVSVDGSGKIVSDAGTLAIDQVAIISDKTKKTPAELVRSFAYTELKRGSSLELLPLALIDLELPHHAFGNQDSSPNLEKIYSTPASGICGQFLDCDAVLYGFVKRWDRDYYAVQSVNSVEVEFRLVSARDEKLLFQSEGYDLESRGLLKGPTGYSSIALEPIKGLDSAIISSLAESVVTESLKPLIVRKTASAVEGVEPPAIFASSHDSRTGVLDGDGRLVVLSFATPGAEASFSVGSAVENIPMLERAPGRYVGEYFPLDGERFDSQWVTVKMRNKNSELGSSQVVKKGPVTLR